MCLCINREKAKGKLFWENDVVFIGKTEWGLLFMIPFIMIHPYQLKFGSRISFSTWNASIFYLLYASCISNHFKNVYFSFSLNGEIIAVVGFAMLIKSHHSVCRFLYFTLYQWGLFSQKKKGGEISGQNSFDNESNSRHMNKPTCLNWPKLGLWNPLDSQPSAIKIWTMRFARYSVKIYEIFFTSISVPLLFFAIVVQCRSFLK